MLSIGLMSGTSMDGIDAALLETDGTEKNIKALGYTSIAYSPFFKIALKAAEWAVRKSSGQMPNAHAYYSQAVQEFLADELKLSAAERSAYYAAISDYLGAGKHTKPIVSLNAVIRHSTDLHAKVVKKLLGETGYAASQIDVIGYHGQTLLHRPQSRISVIVGDGQYLANELGVTVVNDFRSQDIAAGGQGAPFAPLYHQALAIRDQKIPAVVVNCGGIANITLVSNTNELDLIAYDTGPGNGLIDRLVRQRTNGKENMDAHGQYGRQGNVHEDVIKKLYEKAIIKNGQNYFSLMPPQSLDIGDMQLIPELDLLSLEDACATLEAFTADSLLCHLERLKIAVPPHWILAGGGWNNPVLCRELKNRLHQKWGSDIKMSHADEIGWNSQSLEAQMFAYYAVRRLQNKFISFPGTTGVSRPLTGGCIYKPASIASAVFL